MKQVFNKTHNISYYYGEWHPTGDLEDFLNSIKDKQFTITIETLDCETQEEHVPVTYRELFNRANDSTLTKLGVNPYYMNEGGDPTNIIHIPKTIAMEFMNTKEFNGRKL